MSYATRQDIETLYGASHLQTLVAHDVDLDQAVARALASAQGRMDPYLRQRYSLPLPQPVPDTLQQIAIDIACWLLAPAADRMSEQIEKRAKLQLEFLKDVAAGKAEIAELAPFAIGQTGEVGQAAASGAFFSAEPRRWGGGL